MNSDLKAAEATISVMNESKQTQISSMNSMERKTEALKSQLQESQVNERLAEQKLSNLKEQLEDTRSRMVCLQIHLANSHYGLLSIDAIKISNKFETDCVIITMNYY